MRKKKEQKIGNPNIALNFRRGRVTLVEWTMAKERTQFVEIKWQKWANEARNRHPWDENDTVSLSDQVEVI